jgi:hypothetical protein
MDASYPDTIKIICTHKEQTNSAGSYLSTHHRNKQNTHNWQQAAEGLNQQLHKLFKDIKIKNNNTITGDILRWQYDNFSESIYTW